MLIIYHSRSAFGARQAAAIQLGLLPPEPPQDLQGLTRARELLGGPGDKHADGLWHAGAEETANCTVLALGRASRPDVVHRAVHSLAGLFGISSESYLLQNVGAPVAWGDLKVKALRLLGLSQWADRTELRGLSQTWRGAAKAAKEMEGRRALLGEDGPDPRATKTTPLNLVYYCYGSAHSSVTAANLHLGHLPLNRRATLHEILHQPLFDRAEDYEIGFFKYMGADQWGNDIYVLGLAGGKKVMQEALLAFLRWAGVDTRLVRFEMTLKNAGVILRVGGYTSRGLGWVKVGRPLCVLGVWLKYHGFAKHVRQMRAWAGLPAHRPPFS